MVIDVEALLAPVSGDNPVGEDLDGSPGRYAIEEPFQLDAGAADGEEIAIDWRDTVRRIVAQFDETKDLWLAVYLMRAGAKLGDFDAVVGGAQAGRGLLERYWDTVHPQLEMVDFIGRKAPFEALTKLRDFLNPLKQVILVQHPRLGRYSIADVQRMAQEGPGAEGYGMFQAALGDMGPGEVAAVRDKVAALVEAVHGMDTALTANALVDTSTNFAPTYQVLDEIRSAVDSFVYVEPEAEAADGGGGTEGGLDDFDFGDLDALLADVTGGDGGGAASGDGEAEGAGDTSAVTPETVASAPARAGQRPAGARRPGGPPTTRAEAMASLQAVESYYRTHEPGSPIVAILARARTWADMDFMALLKDLSPDSVGDARRVLGIKDDGY